MSNTIETILPLLKRWSELACNECRRMHLDNESPRYIMTTNGYFIKVKSLDQDGCFSIRQDADLTFTPKHLRNTYLNPDLAPLFIEGAIREAIEKRGWRWYMNGAADYGLAQIRIQEINHETKMRSHDTVVEALLTAYIQALEANQ